MLRANVSKYLVFLCGLHNAKCVASLCYDQFFFFSAEEDKKWIRSCKSVVKNATAVKLSSIGKKAVSSWW